MTSTQTQLRRGTQAQNDALTGAVGEITVDTTNDRGRLHDGSKIGGFHLPNHEDIQNNKMAYAAAGGTVDAITATYYPVPAAPGDGARFDFKASGPNTGPATFQANYAGATADDIVKDDGEGNLIALEGGEFAAGGIYTLKRTGSDWHLQAAGTRSGGGWEEIATTGYGASPYIQFTGLDPDFSAFEIEFSEIGTAVGNQGFYLWLGVDGGAVVTSSNNYQNTTDLIDMDSSPSRTLQDGPGSAIQMINGSGPTEFYDGGNYRGISGRFRIDSPALASFRPTVEGNFQCGGSAQPFAGKVWGHTKFNGADVTAIRIGTLVNNLTHGVATLRGFREA